MCGRFCCKRALTHDVDDHFNAQSHHSFARRQSLARDFAIGTNHQDLGIEVSSSVGSFGDIHPPINLHSLTAGICNSDVIKS